MLKVSTIACPKCATRLRVRSLDGVSETDTCPECGTPLKPAADQQSADLHAAEAEPQHPALATSEDTPGRPGPAGIAAAVTALLGLAIAVPLLLSAPESDSVANPGKANQPVVSATEKDAPATQSKVPRQDSIAAIDRRADSPDSAPEDDRDRVDVAVAKPFDPETVTPADPPSPEISAVPDGIRVAVASTDSADKGPIQQASGTNAEQGGPSGGSIEKNSAPPTSSNPAAPPPPSIDERLNVPISEFELQKPVTLKSVLETVEIMAGIRVDLSAELATANLDREVVFSLENTTPRGILNEAATRVGLVVSVSGDRVSLKPADR